jgi:hypothetical protein
MNQDVFVQDNFELEIEAAIADSQTEQSGDGQSDLWVLTIVILSMLLIVCLARSVDAFPHWMSGQVSPLFANVGPHFHR